MCAGSSQAELTLAAPAAAAARMGSVCLTGDPSLHPLPWDYLLCSWGGNFREGRKKRESSKTSLSPSQPVSVQGSPLIRGWVFGGHVPASIIPERRDKAFEIHRGELYVESHCKSFKKKKRQLY